MQSEASYGSICAQAQQHETCICVLLLKQEHRAPLQLPTAAQAKTVQPDLTVGPPEHARHEPLSEGSQPSRKRLRGQQGAAQMEPA